MLLAVSIGADLAAHEHAGEELMAQLSSHDAELVAAHQAAEAANPWHRVIVTGQALLIGGLAVCYLSERARRTAGPPGG